MKENAPVSPSSESSLPVSDVTPAFIGEKQSIDSQPGHFPLASFDWPKNNICMIMNLPSSFFGGPQMTVTNGGKTRTCRINC